MRPLLTALLWLAAACSEPPEIPSCPDGFTCDFTCEADACGEVVCGPTDCTVDCAQEAQCPGIDCTDALCDVRCTGGSACDAIDCTGAAGCVVECSGASTCNVDCTGARVCDDVRCTGDSGCLLLCADASNCAFASCDGGSGMQTCPGDVLACNRACPTCGDGTCDAGIESASGCPEDCGPL